MKNKTKESISRILLIVFWVMLIIILVIMSPPGTIVPLYVCLGFLLPVLLLIDVEKHRKYVCIGMTVILLLVLADHVAGRILYQERIKNLEIKLDEYENSPSVSH